MLITGIVLFILGIFLFINSLVYIEYGLSFLRFLCSLIFICIGLTLMVNTEVASNPTEQDVLSKKAVYIETIHVTDNDTIKTYEIKWKDETEN